MEFVKKTSLIFHI